MTPRENVLSIFRRTGYRHAAWNLNLCDFQIAQYKEKTGSLLHYEDYFQLPLRQALDLAHVAPEPEQYMQYYKEPFAPGTVINSWGVAQEPAKNSQYHFFKVLHPMQSFDSAEQVEHYPLPRLPENIVEILRKSADDIHAAGNASAGRMSVTIWETAWFMRGMETLLMDMLTESPIAVALLDRLTELSCQRAENYARAGFDVLHIGDDVSTQKSLFMSEAMYCEWLKPRIAKVIAAAKAVNPDILIFYHCCGFAKPFIKHFIDVGVEILDPVQPESMDFAEIYAEYGSVLSFHGTLGTQTTLPFGTPKDVKDTVWRNLDIAGEKGGLVVCPTHTVEPEVPWENIVAYIEACKTYR